MSGVEPDPWQSYSGRSPVAIGAPWETPPPGAWKSAIFGTGLAAAGLLIVAGAVSFLQFGLPSDPGDKPGDLERLESVKGILLLVIAVCFVLALVLVAVLMLWKSTWKGAQVFIAPPDWPPPPEGWRPPPLWRPDPSWPEPPPEWIFWRRRS